MCLNCGKQSVFIGKLRTRKEDLPYLCYLFDFEKMEKVNVAVGQMYFSSMTVIFKH